ncbi:hypothetical protein GT347_22380 [Xylophilus rhododendri]|uniref:Toxic anion resistance protein n=1 Tax=Xylophilus rhododendri TaxID=2697032 RepID=A0A857JCK5_9BURK|nr:hypothetical protein [Xylophilus rhododendri]QHJ00479.1 hypothetical protein GT347_22380 [Xylophilus rhododendri]
MTPRIVGTPAPGAVPATLSDPQPLPGLAPQQVAIPANLGFTPPPEALDAVARQVDGIDPAATPLLALASLGSDADVALHRSLGAFLDRIDKAQNPQLFKLVAELNREVAAQDLPGLADRILDGKPGFLEKLGGLFSRRGAAASANALFEQLRALVAGRTATLKTLMDRMERDIEAEKKNAIAEAQNLESLKNQYRAHFSEFAMATILVNTLAHKAQAQFDAAQAAVASSAPDALDSGSLQDLQDKVLALQNRALALEGVFTKLPAEQLVIRQVQTAAVQTVLEVSTTTAQRFASIKMTLLSLHGALATQSLQRIAEQGAQLDSNLAAARAKVVGNVVATAANAPGDNRLRQAGQLRDIVTQTAALQQVVEDARRSNAQKFEEARGLLSQARTDLAQLGATIRPDRPFQP